MKVKTLRLHPNAAIPKKAYPNDFCYDVVAVSEEEIAPNVWKYGLGIAFQIERGPESMVMSTLLSRRKRNDTSHEDGLLSLSNQSQH